MAMPEHLKLWNFKVEASSWYWTVTGPDGDDSRIDTFFVAERVHRKRGPAWIRRSQAQRGASWQLM
jgi:hypothetical protein